MSIRLYLILLSHVRCPTIITQLRLFQRYLEAALYPDAEDCPIVYNFGISLIYTGLQTELRKTLQLSSSANVINNQGDVTNMTLGSGCLGHPLDLEAGHAVEYGLTGTERGIF